jgi:hypothetical protein
MSLTIGDTESLTIGDAETKTVQRRLQVSGELQVSGNLTVNNVRELDASAEDGDSSQSPLTRIRELQSTSADVDSSTATTTRIRELAAGQRLLVRDGTTVRIDDPTTEHSAVVSGRLVVTSDLTINDEAQPAQDSDTSRAATTREREITAQASDTDASLTPLTRGRDLQATASDVDVATATTERVRILVANAEDGDSATTVFLPSSASTDPRRAIIDILQGNSEWPGQEPIVKPIEQTTPKTRQNTVHPAIYVHKPVDDELTRFSAESLALEEDETVELYIYILKTEDETPPERAAREYRNRVINVLSAYMNDNYSRTEFLYLEPSGATDARASTIARQTDHYVYAVEIDTHRLEQQL